MHIDELMSQFRIGSRELFNHFFRKSHQYQADDSAWLLEERFREVEKVLFRKLVTEPAGISFIEYGEIQREIAIRPRYGDSTSAMFNREIKSGYWDFPVDSITRDTDLAFISFFDWDALSYRDNQHVRAEAMSWSSHPEIIGKQVLIEARNVEFFLRQ